MTIFHDRKLFLSKLVLIAFAAAAIAFAGTRSIQSTETAIEPEAETAAQVFTFRHSDPQHQRLPCLLCHQRTDNSPQLKRGGHSPCSGCHVEQFKETSGPFCAVCHNYEGVKPFPSLRSFSAKFDHGRHLRQTNCTTCHRPSRAGVALSIPRRFAAHTTCFSCHGSQTKIAGKNIGSCDTCHSPGRPARTSEWAKAFSMNFSHSEHARGKQSCSECHTVRTRAARGLQVSSPQPAMHFASPRAMSCATCHDGKRSFGANDFKNCKRCHEGSTFKF